MHVYIINGRRAIRNMRRMLFVLVGVLVVAFALRLAAGAVGGGDHIPVISEATKVIVIDAGHGGEDPGAVGVNGCLEKDINLEMALLVGEELKKRGYEVVYTRTDDRMLYTEEENINGLRKLSDLKNRCKISSESSAALFISLHMNSYGDSRYSGLQVYHTDKSGESEKLAQSIQSSVKTELQPDNERRVKSGKDLYLLENCSGVGVLVECGFLTNAAECEKLSQKEYQKQLSFAIVCGIINYIENSENTAN